MLTTFLSRCVETIDIACYTIDQYFSVSIQQCLGRKVQVRVLVDQGQMRSPSCTQQASALLAMTEWGAKLRSRKPGTSFNSAQHEKSWLFDRQMVVVGSMNLTTNSVLNCEESVCATREMGAVDAYAAHYSAIWEEAEEVTREDLERCYQSRRSVSRGRAKSMSRVPPGNGSED